MSVFKSKLGKLSDFQRAQPGEHPISIDPTLVDYLEQDRSADNPGLAPDSLSELAGSMKADGQLMPAIVRPNPMQPGRYIMVAGERRGRAAHLAGMKLLVYVRQLSDEQHRSIQRAENIQREALTQLEIARAIHRDRTALGTLAAVASAWNKSISWVAERVALVDAVDAGGIAAKVVEDGVSADVSTIAAIAKLERVDPVAAQRVLDSATPDTNLRQEARKALDKAKAAPITNTNTQVEPSPSSEQSQKPKDAPPHTSPSKKPALSLNDWLKNLDVSQPLRLVKGAHGWVLRSGGLAFEPTFTSLDNLVLQLSRIAAITGTAYYSALEIDIDSLN